MIKHLLAALVLVGAGCASTPSALPTAVAPPPTPDQALRQLLDGNARFVSGRSMHGGTHSARRAEVVSGQKPIAVVVGCSDSRVGPEIVLDQGLGDIFVIRTAGNVVDDIGLGSIEYAVEHLKSPLILVIGHERCGAVMAAVEGGHAPGHIGAVIRAIEPAVQKTRGRRGDPIDNAVLANVRGVVDQLRKSDPILAEHVKAGTLDVVGARYDLDTGRLEIVK